MRKLALLLVVLAVLPLHASKRRAANQPSNGERVLFVGNSLTYFHDLPSMVCRLAAREQKPLACTMIAYGNTSLRDHLDLGEASAAIATRSYTLVVLQQGTSALDDSRAELIASATTFASLIRAAGARPALYGVWPQSNRQFDFQRTIDSYRLAAEATNAQFFSVGAAWLRVMAADPTIRLYGIDGLHPTRAAAYLAALVIYRGLSGELPDSFARQDVAQAVARGTLSITDAQLRTLWAAANY